MVALYIPANAANVVSSFEIPGDAGPALVTFGLTDLAAVTPDDCAEAVADAWNANGGWLDFLPAAVALREVFVYKNIGSDVIANGYWSGNFVGAAGGSIAPPNVTYLSHKLTGLGGRQQRGRMFIPGVLESAVTDGGFIESGSVTALQGANDTLLAELAANAGPMTVLHTSPAAFLQEVTTLQLAPKVATQRRRLR